MNILCVCNDVGPLVQKITSLLLGKAVLTHFQQDLVLHCAFLCVQWYVKFQVGEEGIYPYMGHWDLLWTIYLFGGGFD